MKHELSLPGRGVAVEKLAEASKVAANCNSTLVRSSIGHCTMQEAPANLAIGVRDKLVFNYIRGCMSIEEGQKLKIVNSNSPFVRSSDVGQHDMQKAAANLIDRSYTISLEDAE